MVVDALHEFGITYKDLMKSEIAEEDLDAIKKAFGSKWKEYSKGAR